MKKENNKLGYLLIVAIIIIGTVLSFAAKIELKKVVEQFNYDVIIILICMELFTNLVCKTGIIERISLNLSAKSKGNKRTCLILFGFLMFFISSFLNNITAVLMILPIIFVLFKSIGIDKKYFDIFFAVILVMSNTGGAASPIGDFPAIVIMSSGITTFRGYLIRAFPFFLATSIFILFWWILKIKKENKNSEYTKLSIELLNCRYKYFRINKKAILGLSIILILMLISWILVPPSIVPTEIVALIGFSVAMVYCSFSGIAFNLYIDFKSILTVSSFLYLATVVSLTGYLEQIVVLLQNSIDNPIVLLLSIMIFASLVSGLFGAGPAATAMMPIIIHLCNTSFAASADWVAVAYASSICAGSSLFMWSATAGLILSKKIEDVQLRDESNNNILLWNIKNYFKYGIQNYLMQMAIAIIIIYIVL